MFSRLARLLIVATLVAGNSSLVHAEPVVFVPDGDGAAWWARELTLRPSAKRVAGVDVSAINAWRQATKGLRDPDLICFIQAINQRSIVSPRRLLQNEIEETFVEFPDSFQQEYVTKSGNKFLVRVVAFESCDIKPRFGTGVLITNKLENFVSFIESEFIFTRLFKRDDGVINIFGCYSCGDVSELRYNPDSDEFYLKWIGH